MSFWTIERNTKALAQIIEDLLDVSRIITGKLRLEAIPVDLAPIVEASLEAVQPAIDAKKIHVEVTMDPSVGAILGDASRLQQIVWNLLSNAIKFTSSGGRVGVRLERAQSSARISVSDTGEGISGEFLPFVFDRFRQADSTFARTHGGLGLGLAIVRHLVEMHGGAVGADSPGRGMGSTFTVSFPLMSGNSSAQIDKERPAKEDKPKRVSPPELDGLRVLIVDDELDTREVLLAMLEQRGANVIVASSASEALDALGPMPSGPMPDVLVSDIGMPGEDGLDLIAKIRALAPEQGGRIPAIALTAYARARRIAPSFWLPGFNITSRSRLNPRRLLRWSPV